MIFVCFLIFTKDFLILIFSDYASEKKHFMEQIHFGLEKEHCKNEFSKGAPGWHS